MPTREPSTLRASEASWKPRPRAASRGPVPQGGHEPGSGHPGAGFTLIEVLVAITVLALISAVLLRAVVALRRDAADVSDDASRLFVARTVLDEALRNRKLRDGTYRGAREGWPWLLVATRVDLGGSLISPPSRDGGAAKPTPWRPQHLVVRIGAEGASVALETTRLVTP